MSCAAIIDSMAGASPASKRRGQNKRRTNINSCRSSTSSSSSSSSSSSTSSSSSSSSSTSSSSSSSSSGSRTSTSTIKPGKSAQEVRRPNLAQNDRSQILGLSLTPSQVMIVTTGVVNYTRSQRAHPSRRACDRGLEACGGGTSPKRWLSGLSSSSSW